MLSIKRAHPRRERDFLASIYPSFPLFGLLENKCLLSSWIYSKLFFFFVASKCIESRISYSLGCNGWSVLHPVRLHKILPLAGMTFQWCLPVKEMLCKRDFYGQQHSNGIQICNASPNIDLKPSKAERLLTKRGLQTLGEAGSSKMDRCQASQHLGMAEKYATHPSTSQSIFIECRQEKITYY